MKHSNHFFYIMFCIILALSCVCESRLFMVSQEGKLQISDDYGENWMPYNFGFLVDKIEFFDVYYDASINTVYVTGYDTQSNTLVLFYLTNGVVYENPQTIILLWYPTPEDNIEFMKVRPAFNTINIFGRAHYKKPYIQLSDHQFYFRGSRENFHVFQKDGLWHRVPSYLSLSPEGAPTSSTIMDMVPVPNLEIEGANYVYTTNDINAIGPYPFYRSSYGQGHIMKLLQPHEVHILDQSMMPHITTPTGYRYPMLYQHPQTRDIFLIGNDKSGLFSQKIHGTPHSFTYNANYTLFGTALLDAIVGSPHNKSLFFVAHKGAGRNPLLNAVIARGDSVELLHIVQPINDALQVEGINRDIGVQALKNNGFYRFVKEKGSYLFFLSYVDEYKRHHALVLRSKDGNTWKPIRSSSGKILPQKVREIISVP